MSFELDAGLQSLVNGDETVGLTATEFRLLEALMTHRAGLVRRAELVTLGWAPGARVSDNTLDSFMARLRRALRRAGVNDTIETVRGVGFRLQSCAASGLDRGGQDNRRGEQR